MVELADTMSVPTRNPPGRSRVDAVSDDDLISMYRNGDAEAFDVLFDRYYRSVFNFALYMVHDSGRAEDILQETFLAIARTAKRYEPRGHFRTWLMRIVRNRCLNCLEAERIRREALKEAADRPDVSSREPGPEQCAQADELTGQLRRLVMNLPERQREAIVLFAFEKMSYQDIAESLDLPLNTVKTLTTAHGPTSPARWEPNRRRSHGLHDHPRDPCTVPGGRSRRRAFAFAGAASGAMPRVPLAA